MLVANACIKVSIVFAIMTCFRCCKPAYTTATSTKTFESSKITYFNSWVLGFISPDKFQLNDTPYAYCDLDPVNKIDNDGNAPAFILPSEFELELGLRPRFITRASEQPTFDRWQKYYVKVKNGKISYFTGYWSLTEPPMYEQTSYFRIVNDWRSTTYTLKKYSNRINPEYGENLTLLKSRIRHVKRWIFNTSGQVNVKQEVLVKYPVDRHFMDELSRLSIGNSSAVFPQAASASTSAVTSSSASGASAVLQGNNPTLTDAIPGTSTQNEFISLPNRAVITPQTPHAATGACNYESSSFDRSMHNSSPLGELDFFSSPSLDQVMNMPAPHGESEFNSTTNWDDIMDLIAKP